MAALTGLNEFTQANKNDGGDIIGQVATQIGIPTTDVLQIISDALDRPDGSIMNEMERQVFNAAAQKTGQCHRSTSISEIRGIKQSGQGCQYSSSGF